jgi:glucose-6-phosphate isomerase
MPLTLDTTNSQHRKVGKHGITPKKLKETQPQVLEALAAIKRDRAAGKLPFLDLPDDKATALACKKMAARFTDAENLIISGIGGSALGPQAIFSALGHPLHNLISRAQRNGAPRLFILDNVDPDQTEAIFEFCKPDKTVYNIISKSGATAETAAAALMIFDRLRQKLGASWKKQVVCTTDPKNGDLRALCNELRLKTLELHPGVGGRFSVLTPVGLFPAYCLGFDVDELLKGASAMRERCLSDNFDENPAAQMATYLYLFDTTRGKPMHVMMAYANALYSLADWFRQIWAESLGKAKDIHGTEVNVGPTPLKALGATDQHSQIQLYIEGPHDKVFIFLEAKKFHNDLKLPAGFPHVSSLNYLGGQSMNKLMAAEFSATREALARQERPSMTITFDEINAHTVGEFFMLLELTTSIAGSLYNINPYDQPGVELGKILTYSLMGRKGYEGRAEGM